MILRHLISIVPMELWDEFDEFCELNYKRCIGIAESFLDNYEDAEEVVADSFVYIAKNYAELDRTNPKAVAVYLFRAVEDRAKNLKKKRDKEKKHRYTPVLDEDGEPISIVSPADTDLEREYIKNEMATAVREELEKLPDIYRKAIKLYFYEGLTMREISNRADISVGAVHNRIEQGYKLLRKRMEARGYHGYEK